MNRCPRKLFQTLFSIHFIYSKLYSVYTTFCTHLNLSSYPLSPVFFFFSLFPILFCKFHFSNHSTNSTCTISFYSIFSPISSYMEITCFGNLSSAILWIRPYRFSVLLQYHLTVTSFLFIYCYSDFPSSIWWLSTIRLSPLGLFLPLWNHLLISFVVFLYFFSLQVCNLNFFLGSLLSSILCICSLQFILYCVNLSFILKIPNCSLMSLLIFLSCHWS